MVWSFGSLFIFAIKVCVWQVPQFVWFIFLISRRTWHWLLFENSQWIVITKAQKGFGVVLLLTFSFGKKYIFIPSFVYFFFNWTNICRISAGEKRNSLERWSPCFSCLSTGVLYYNGTSLQYYPYIYITGNNCFAFFIRLNPKL